MTIREILIENIKANILKGLTDDEKNFLISLAELCANHTIDTSRSMSDALNECFVVFENNGEEDQ